MLKSITSTFSWWIVPLAMALAIAVSSERPAGQASRGAGLTVFAASDVALALDEIAEAFGRREGVRTTLVFGSSGNLSLQIEHGAPADVFLSANDTFVDRLAAVGRIEEDTRATYAMGRVVLATGRGISPGLTDLSQLVDARIRRIAIANPAHAPYGMAAEEALRAAGVWEAVRPRLVHGENVRHAQQFVETGAVDAALVARTLIGDSDLHWILVDARLHAPLVQPAVVVRGNRSPDVARRFVAWLTGPEARAVLLRHGFEFPPGG